MRVSRPGSKMYPSRASRNASGTPGGRLRHLTEPTSSARSRLPSSASAQESHRRSRAGRGGQDRGSSRRATARTCPTADSRSSATQRPVRARQPNGYGRLVREAREDPNLGLAEWLHPRPPYREDADGLPSVRRMPRMVRTWSPAGLPTSCIWISPDVHDLHRACSSSARPIADPRSLRKSRLPTISQGRGNLFGDGCQAKRALQLADDVSAVSPGKAAGIVDHGLEHAVEVEARLRHRSEHLLDRRLALGRLARFGQEPSQRMASRPGRQRWSPERPRRH